MRGRRPSWIACWVSEKAPVITAWLAMMVATVASADHRQQRPVRIEQEEGVLDLRRIGEQQRALAEIVQGEAGQHEAEPGGLDRLAAEMAHVGIERLGAGDGQEHGPEGEQARRAVGGEESDAVGRADRGQDAGVVGDVDAARRAPSATNQTAVIGPNQAATRAVPWLCTANRPTRITRLSGRT